MALLLVKKSYEGLLALLLGARTLLGAPGLSANNNKKLLARSRGALALLLVRRARLATRSKDATRKLLRAPGLTTSNKKLLGAPSRQKGHLRIAKWVTCASVTCASEGHLRIDPVGHLRIDGK